MKTTAILFLAYLGFMRSVLSAGKQEHEKRD